MLQRPNSPYLLGLFVSVALVACGGDSGDTGDDEVGETETGDGDGDTADTTDTTTDTTDTTTDTTETETETETDTTETETDTTDETETDTTDTMGDCMVWEITYDLTDSVFEISDTPLGAGDQVNVVEEPYDADDTVGPGNFVIRFQDVDGEPGGTAFMYSYEMSMHFAVQSTGATVTTDLENDAGPEDCGITSGALDGTTVAWMPSTIVGHHSMGQILCMGNFCMLGGLPNGMPVPVDETTDQPISDFEFSGDLTSFTMEETVVQMDMNSTTSWVYEGTEVSRDLVAAPACLCE